MVQEAALCCGLTNRRACMTVDMGPKLRGGGGGCLQSVGGYVAPPEAGKREQRGAGKEVGGKKTKRQPGGCRFVRIWKLDGV